MMRFACRAALALVLCGSASRAAAEPWTRSYINSLPDSSFASIETTPDGKKVRHLPHHTRNGHLNPAHVRNALSRLSQVQWVDPKAAAAARAHLQQHLQELQSTHREE